MSEAQRPGETAMKNPFIAGNWVRGERFFGRQHLIREILEGQRQYLWVAGTRRLGKTSLLKQLEYLTREGPYANRYVPLFWDIQGSQTAAGLQESLLESVDDAADRFEAIGVDLDALEDEDVFGILRTLKRRAKEANLTLLLLCDEVEELINVEKHNPEVLPRLRRFFQRGDNVFTVLTATRRLSVLEKASLPNTSPFLSGFVPPVYLPLLEEPEARRLIQQWPFSEEVVQAVLAKTDRHPYLIQLVCRRLVEVGDLGQVVEEVVHDDMISHFFSVDFQYLQDAERTLLLHVLQSRALSLRQLETLMQVPAPRIIQMLFELSQLGMVNQVDGEYGIANYFFEQWLWREKERLFSPSELKRAQPTKTAAAPALRTSPLPKVGEHLAQHEILEQIGSGGMGVVFKGRDVKLNRLVALKVLAPALMSDPDFKARFLLEAQTASALNHPNICTIYQIGEEAGLLFISMELVEGETLRTWAAEGERTLLEKLKVAIEAAKGLAHAHSKGVIHRDIKAENIMVTHEGGVKIMDFGLAKAARSRNASLTKTGTTLGTLAYMSPEQVSGLDVDHRSDIFSFGIVLYELLTGQLPFTGEYELSIMYAILNETPAPLRALKPELPEEPEALIHQALQKDRDQRPASMLEVVTALEGLCKQL